MKKILLFLIIGIFLISSVYADGFTVTSVSTSQVFTKTTDPSTNYWIINTQLNGGGQSLYGSVDPSTIKGFTKGVSSKLPLTIEVTSNSEQAFYEIVNQETAIYKYDQVTYNDYPTILGIISGDPKTQCSAGTTWTINVGKSLFGFAKIRYCITKRQVGIKGVYNNPNVGFNANIKLSAGSTTKVKTICSGGISGCDGSSVDFDGLGTATWTGSLVTGDSAPNQDNYVPIKRLDSNQWQISTKSTFDSYSQAESAVYSQFEDFKNSLEKKDENTAASQINTQLNIVNPASDKLMSESTSFSQGLPSTIDNNGKVTITLSRKLSSPNILFKIRADWIGIVIPTGQPKILSVQSNKFSSGEAGSVSVQIQNKGDAAGTYSAMLVNCDPFIQSASEQTARKTLQPGDTDTIVIPISGGSLSDDTLKDCSVKVYDVNDPSLIDNSAVTLQLEKAKICNPNEIFNEGNVIKKCSADGKSIEIIKTCEKGVERDSDGNLVCIVSEVAQTSNVDSSSGSSVTGNAIASVTKKPSMIVGIIIVVVFVILIGGSILIYTLKNRSKKTK